MMLETLALLGEALTGVGAMISILYLTIEFQKSARTVRASAFQQVVNSFASFSFDTARHPELVDLWMRAAEDFDALSELERTQYSLLLLSLLRRAENVFVQDALHNLDEAHWSGIRQSIVMMMSTSGARACWALLKGRLHPQFREFLDELIASDAPSGPPPPVGRPSDAPESSEAQFDEPRSNSPLSSGSARRPSCGRRAQPHRRDPLGVERRAGLSSTATSRDAYTQPSRNASLSLTYNF